MKRASFVKRFLAFLIDNFTLGLIALILSMIAGAAGGLGGGNAPSNTVFNALVSLATLVYAATVWALQFLTSGIFSAPAVRRRASG